MDSIEYDLYYIDMHLDAIDVRIHRIARSYCTPQWSWRHNPDGALMRGLVFWLIAGGRGHLDDGGVQYQLGTGDCFFLRMSEARHATNDPGSPLVVPWINFEFTTPEGKVVEPGMSMLPVHRRVQDIRFLDGLFDRCLDACEAQGKEGISARHWLKCILMEVLREDRRIVYEGGAVAWSKEIDLICAEIRSEPGSSISVAEMAERANLSEDHFIRVFKKAKGVTPGEFVLGARIDSAVSLLLFTSRTISEIADELGYCDIFHFSKQFKKRMGVSPRNYRHTGTAHQVSSIV